MSQTPTINNISIDLLIPNPYQPRKIFKEETINELAASIKEYGILNPILIRPVNEQYQIIAGERRVKAAKQAGLKEIPAIIKDLDDKQVASIALIENLQRENLNPLEEAKSYKEILTLTGMTEKELGIKIGKSQGTIANKMRLLNLPSNVQEAIMQKQISEKHARSLMKVSSQEKQTEYLNKTIQNKLTVKELDNLINQKEITEEEIQNAIKDIMKSLNIEEDSKEMEEKKEEKESDNMNNGNFFPNFNNQMDTTTPVSLNSMNMQSMQNPQPQPMNQVNEMVMPSQGPVMPDQTMNMNSMINPQPQGPITQPLPNNNFTNPQEQPLFAPTIEPQIVESPLPTMPDTTKEPINIEPIQPIQDTPLFTPTFENQPSPIETTQPENLSQPAYEIPVSSQPTIAPIQENNTSDKLTAIKEYLNELGVSYKTYSNETNKCIIIEI